MGGLMPPPDRLLLNPMLRRAPAVGEGGAGHNVGGPTSSNRVLVSHNVWRASLTVTADRISHGSERPPP